MKKTEQAFKLEFTEGGPVRPAEWIIDVLSFFSFEKCDKEQWFSNTKKVHSLAAFASFKKLPLFVIKIPMALQSPY